MEVNTLKTNLTFIDQRKTNSSTANTPTGTAQPTVIPSSNMEPEQQKQQKPQPKPRPKAQNTPAPDTEAQSSPITYAQVLIGETKQRQMNTVLFL